MLILTRREGEVIKIGEEITIKITHVKCGFVKVGIDAPRDIPVHRKEIYDKINSNLGE